MATQLPSVGSVYWFRTLPYSEFAPPITNRFASLKVIGSDAKHIVVAVLDSVWSSPPTLRDVHACAILRQRRFAHTGTPAVWGLATDWWDVAELNEVTPVGTAELTQEESRLAADVLNVVSGTSIAALGYANYVAEGEWRWANDREAFVAEHERTKAKEAANLATQEERYRTRLRGLTWDQLLAETPFARWSNSPPFPSAEFTGEAREAVHRTCRALQALGGRPRKADVRRVLRECVEWFNAADSRSGGVIETEEREDICEIIEEMAHVARQRSLVDEIELWRQW
jgi:hypothetical protein